ncbi:hypothetical protein CS022_24670 [Veronia nyctiphanis]|uniref:Uncharacterized protein n=1 Tax=Veronia nyctiphanis TaxID=1278244 RepID=A0A4Q0Y6Z1_9GAMM|nr:hypothetical protein [Veronia nyctiphanis]RXJ65950.1 hypothetical protein CS022_24670 [Veronia nyctiphanis]
MRIIVFGMLLLTACYSVAENLDSYERSGSLDMSVAATSKEGFECNAKAYLLSKLPIFFTKEFSKAGLLRESYVGQYKLALVIDEQSNIVGYQTAPGTDEQSLLVQTVITLDKLPALDANSACVAGKPFIYEFTLS